MSEHFKNQDRKNKQKLTESNKKKNLQELARELIESFTK